MTIPTLITARFRHIRTTPGALIFKEIDERSAGQNVYNQPNEPGCKIGQIYLRKSEIPEGFSNSNIIVTITPASTS